MLHRKKIIASALMLTIGAGLAGGAVAQTSKAGALSVIAQNSTTESTAGKADREVKELQAVQNAKVTIGDAAKAAEAETGGKAVDVSINDENGQIAYDVEVALADGAMKEVRVDSQTGQVLKVSADTEDQEGNEDESGEQGENGEEGENGEN